ncbi:MAG TPA: AMP-binding protein [Acidimicrobiales bacterium]|nr:AMP-binding protein [Acidimicrobiales bacterium]
MSLEGFSPWPEEAAHRYRREGWWRGERLGALPRVWADRSGTAEALVDQERRLTYRELAEEVDALALGLVDAGVAPGEHLIVQLANGVDMVVCCFACYRLGVRPVLTLPAVAASQVEELAAVAGAAGWVGTGEDGAPVLERWGSHGGTARIPIRALADRGVGPRDQARLDALAPDPGDVALFLLSGGTTGLPKLIPRTHQDYALNVRQSAELAGFDATTRFLVVLPVAHNFPYGSPGLLGALHAGGAAVIAPSPNPAVALPLLGAEGVTHTAVVPAVAITWLAAVEETGGEVGSLRVLQVGGARLPAEVGRRVRPVLGCALQQVFGMAEGLLNLTRLDEPEAWAVATQGRPMCPADEVAIVGPDGAQVAPGETGELWARGPYTLRGYFRAPEHNAARFTPEGFYRTGDLVRVDPESGNLVVEGRSRDVVNRGGEKISAEEVENFVLAHPAVRNVAALGAPHPVLGEQVLVAVVLGPSQELTLAQLARFLRDRGVARGLVPERLAVVAELPLTAVGKVDKAALRRRLGL